MATVTKLGMFSIALLWVGCSSGAEGGMSNGVTVDRTQTADADTGTGAPRAGSGSEKSPSKMGAQDTGKAGAAGAPGKAPGMTTGNAAAAGTAGAAADGDAMTMTMAGPAGAAAGSGGSAGMGATDEPAKAEVWNDPGKSPWELVPASRVVEDCKLDPALLAKSDSMFSSGWAVVRYGKLCHEAGPMDTPTEAYSATKTLGALVTGIASYETRMFQRSGPRTGQLLDTDMASDWIANQSYNKDARLAHVLGMEAHNTDLSLGNKTYMYDTVGSVQINTLGDMVNAAISQDAARLGDGITSFTKKFLFEAIGMTDSTWTGAVYAYTWSTTLHDMARVGVLMVHKGMWSGQRVLDESWIYKMTHPSFEDANTGYGYLTWLNARTGSTGPGGAFSGTAADTCAPAALWPRYPHPMSDSPDCNYGGMPCDQEQDVGAWSAQGAGGQFILGHPGLDLVVVAKDYGDGPGGMWNAVRPALVALDPMFKGDEAAFCAAYANNRYAPDLAVPWQAPYDAPAMTP